MNTTTRKPTEISPMFLIIATVLVMAMSMVIGTRAHAASPTSLEQVTGLKQTNSGTSYIFVDWQRTTNPKVKYRIQGSSDKKKWKEYHTIHIPNLNSGSVYYVRVCAYTESYVNGKGWVKKYGPWSKISKCVTTPKDSVKNVRQTAETTTSATISWTAMKGMTNYRVVYGDTENWYYNVGKKEVIVSNKSIKLTGLARNKTYYVEVRPQMVGDTYTASGLYSSIKAAVKPSKPTKLKAEYWNQSIGRLTMSCKQSNSLDGYQWQLLDGKKVLATASNPRLGNRATGIKHAQLRKNKYLKVRVRAYVNINGSKKYGDWSNAKYVAPQPKVKFEKVNKKGFQISWNKIRGANNYTVYIATSQNGKYKKVATTKKTGLTIAKYGSRKLKSGKRYWLRVVANKKVGRTTYKSVSWDSWSKTYYNY